MCLSAAPACRYQTLDGLYTAGSAKLLSSSTAEIRNIFTLPVDCRGLPADAALRAAAAAQHAPSCQLLQSLLLLSLQPGYLAAAAIAPARAAQLWRELRLDNSAAPQLPASTSAVPAQVDTVRYAALPELCFAYGDEGASSSGRPVLPGGVHGDKQPAATAFSGTARQRIDAAEQEQSPDSLSNSAEESTRERCELECSAGAVARAPWFAYHQRANGCLVRQLADACAARGIECRTFGSVYSSTAAPLGPYMDLAIGTPASLLSTFEVAAIPAAMQAAVAGECAHTDQGSAQGQAAGESTPENGVAAQGEVDPAETAGGSDRKRSIRGILPELPACEPTAFLVFSPADYRLLRRTQDYVHKQKSGGCMVSMDVLANDLEAASGGRRPPKVRLFLLLGSILLL